MASPVMEEVSKYHAAGQSFSSVPVPPTRPPILVEEIIHRAMSLIDLVDQQLFVLEDRLALVLRPQPPGQAEEGAAQNPSCPLEESLVQITRRLAASLMFLERVQDRLVL